MQSSHSKTGLVVLFNHNYEKNIPLIKQLYNERFSELRILMPFYYGSDKDVISVFGNSFVFHTYIAQAREKIMAMDCDDFLIIGDDLLLNPDFNEEGGWVIDYSICDIYDEYALVANHAEGCYERVYYSKDDSTDSLSLGEHEKCYIVDVTENEKNVMRLWTRSGTPY